MITGGERMKAWRELDEPKPSWEAFKRLLSQFKTVEQAMNRWNEKRKKNKD